jgi:hypothetical protein
MHSNSDMVNLYILPNELQAEIRRCNLAVRCWPTLYCEGIQAPLYTTDIKPEARTVVISSFLLLVSCSWVEGPNFLSFFFLRSPPATCSSFFLLFASCCFRALKTSCCCSPPAACSWVFLLFASCYGSERRRTRNREFAALDTKAAHMQSVTTIIMAC